MSQKRSYAEFAASSEEQPTLKVVTADGARIPTHNEVLRLVCSCLRNAPASDTWDLSSMLVNGSPVSRVTVEAVLSVIYSSIGALDYEMDRSAGQYSLSQLLDMLLFADAVGCSKAKLGQLAGLLGSTVRAELLFKLTDGSSAETTSSQGRRGGRSGRAAAGAAETAAGIQTVLLQLEGLYGIEDADDNDRRVDPNGDDEHDAAQDIKFVLLSWCGRNFTVVCRLSEQQHQQLRQQAAQQLEALLYVGFKLDLQQLLQPTLRFLRAHADTILLNAIRDKADTMFTLRVLDAASGASGAELPSRACVQQCLGPGFGIGNVFGDIKKVPGDVDDVLSLKATLLHDFDENCKGTSMLVHFDLGGKLLMRPVDPGSDAGTAAYSYSEYSFGVVLGPKHT